MAGAGRRAMERLPSAMKGSATGVLKGSLVCTLNEVCSFMSMFWGVACSLGDDFQKNLIPVTILKDRGNHFIKIVFTMG